MNEGNTKRDSQLQRQEGQLQRQEAQMAELQRTQEQILSHLHLASPLASTTRAVPVNTSFDPSRPFAPAAGGVNTQSSVPSGFRPFAPSASGPVPVPGGASGSVPDNSTGPTTGTGTPGPGGFRSTGIANPVGSATAPAGATGVPNADNLPSGNEWGKFPAGYRATNPPITGPNSLWNVELQVKDRTPVHKSPDQIARQKLMRQWVDTVLGGRGNRLRLTVTTEELDDFEEEYEEDPSQRPCTMDNFRVSVNGHPRCAWNHAAGYVFVQLVESKGWVTPQNDVEREMLRQFFLQRITNIHKEWKRKVTTGGDYARQQQENIVGRQRRTFMIRHKLTKLYRPLNYLTDLLNRIGPDGMSEDEEDG
ncbi:hypothetical protein EV368DRAFT_70542, partial [Lentinula lateritia]